MGNKFYVASNYETMQMIKPMIVHCHNKGVQDDSWYFVILFLCLYAKGNIFGGSLFNESLQQKLLKDFLPSYIEIKGLKIPFQIFESCLFFEDLYRENIEEILLNNCKNYMITSDKMENKKPFELIDTEWNASRFSDWSLQQIIGSKNFINKIEKLFYQLHKKEITHWNVSLLDKLILDSRMYTNYN